MTQLFDPKMDYVFKNIFGSEKHPRILISFLNACIKPADPIVSVNIKNTEVNKEYIEDSYSRLDILAKTDKGEIINVEMQRADERNMIKRSYYYWAKTYSGEYQGKSRYSELSRTICINVLDFNLLNHEDNFHNVYVVRNKENSNYLNLEETFEMHFIEIPKMDVVDNNDLLSLWVKFLDDPNSAEVINMENQVEELHEAKEELARLSRDPKEAEIYRMREKTMNDKMNALLSAKDEGIEVGEKRKAVEIAKKSLSQGIDINTITLITGLSIEEVKQLKR